MYIVDCCVHVHVYMIQVCSKGSAFLFDVNIQFLSSLSSRLSDAVKQITGFLGMQACERSDQVDPNKTSHTLLLAGVFRGGHEVLVRARLAQTGQVTMKMTVRSTDLNTCELVAAAIN